MPWQPALGTQPLAPFNHQVAGQSSMLRYDKTTVCKPLIAREHFVYKTLPHELAEFTPEYRGEIEVQLMEEDGYIQLYGLNVGDEASDSVCSCSSSRENWDHESHKARPDVTSQEASIRSRGTARVLRSGSYEVRPSTDEVFYAADSNPDHPHTQSLNPWSLKNHKRLLDKMLKSEHSHNKIRFILLKNVVADFKHPCILDLKIGSRLHGDDASSVKVASQSAKCSQTTSSTLGVRLCGMQVYQVDSEAYNSVDKYHGRTLNSESFRDMLYNFLHNGSRFRSELIQPIVSRLSQLITCLENLHSFRFYASSLLIIYDGDIGPTSESEDRDSPRDLFTGIQETNKDRLVIPGNREIPQNVDLISVNVEANTQTLLSDITADLSSDKNITEHLPRCKDLLNYVNSPFEKLNSSKELCNSVKKQNQDHLSEEKNLSLTKQSDEVSGYFSAVSCPASCQCLTCRKREQPHNEPHSGKIISEVRNKILDQISPKEESILESCTNHCCVKDLKEPVSQSLCQKTDPTKNNVLNGSGKLGDAALWLNDHVNQQETSHALSSLGVRKEYDVLLHDIPHPEPQSVLLANQKLLVETDVDLGIQSSNVSIVNPTHKPHRETNIDTGLHPSSLSLVNPTQADPLDTEKHVLETDLDQRTWTPDMSSKSAPHTHHLVICEQSAVCNKIQNLSSDQGHISVTDNETLSPTQKSQDSFLAFPALHQKASSSQDIQCVVNTVSLSLTELHSSPTSLSRRSDLQETSPLTSLSQDAVPQDSSPLPKRTAFQDHDRTSLLPNRSTSCSNIVKVDVKMIDFAHTTHRGFTADKVKHIGPDTDYILGLKNLVKLFKDLQRRE